MVVKNFMGNWYVVAFFETMAVAKVHQKIFAVDSVQFS